MPLPKIAESTSQPLVAGRRRSASHVPTPAPVTLLSMQMQRQEQTNWCWSAVSVSVKRFYTPGFPITQCEQANRQLSLTSCCADGASAACNVPWFLNSALDGLGNFARMSAAAVLPALVDAEISANRPLGARIAWSGGGAHFVAIVGCDSASPNLLLTIKDPADGGTSVVPYQTFATAYHDVGTWTHSYLTQP